MTAKTLIKTLLGVNQIHVDGIRTEKTEHDETMLVIEAHPYKMIRHKCPYCGRKCPGYDHGDVPPVHWRAVDFNDVIVEIEAHAERIKCPEHGVVTEAVPWALPHSRFTKNFDLSVAWMARTLNKSAISEYMRISWETVGRCISRVREYLDPDDVKRMTELVNIGIDETSCSKGRKYITTVVNHDTNTVVWVHENHGKAVIDEFFRSLTQEQRDAIKVVSGDGARWITDAVKEWTPTAVRCTDPYHVVSWATEAVDEVRKEAWREAAAAVKDLKKEVTPGKGRPAADDRLKAEYLKARDVAKGIKNARYAVGKAPENLTKNQELKLRMIAVQNPRLYRAYRLKESLRLLLKNKDPIEAEAELEHWLKWAQRCRIDVFIELGRKIRRHKEYILNFIRTGISNARVEANNNKISLLIHKAFGFRNLQNMFDLIMLACSNIRIPLPNRGTRYQKSACTAEI